MFYYLSGQIVHLEPNLAVMDCSGMGFAIKTSTNTLSRLKLGQKEKLYTYYYVHEDVREIYGFFTEAELSCFKLLISISGVGPKAALSILSVTTPESLAMAVITGDEKTLTAAQGVGKKLAQRMILELKDKMAKEQPQAALVMDVGAAAAAPMGDDSPLKQAMAALSVLGYSAEQIAKALKGLDTAGMSTQDIIRSALKGALKP